MAVGAVVDIGIGVGVGAVIGIEPSDGGGAGLCDDFNARARSSTLSPPHADSERPNIITNTERRVPEVMCAP